MTYEYACTSCGHQWEAEQSISAAPLQDCPSCNQATAKRQISGGTGFLLKGGGWYADGYGSKKSTNGGDAKESESPSKGKESSQADSKKPAGGESKAGETQSAGSPASPAASSN